MTYIDYYMGAYGKTIRIVSKSIHWLISFRESIMKVFNNEFDTFDVCKLADTRCSDSISLFKLIKVLNSTTPCVMVNNVNKRMCFYWQQDKEEIETLLGLIDGLIDSDVPCHQYLVHAEDSCIIELSYNEETQS